MKILHLSTYDLEGGAARAAYRLHQGLQRAGADSAMLVSRKSSNDPGVVEASGGRVKLMARFSRLDRLPLLLYPQRQRRPWGVGWLPTGIEHAIKAMNPDIINLHWLSDGFVPLDALAHLNKPVVWTLHDMWAFTGGCHYDEGCGRYQITCGACPRLRSTREHDLSRWVWSRKQRAWQDTALTVVAPSEWLASCARASSLFRARRVERLPYGLDLERFRPQEKAAIRAAHHLPLDKKLILFGAVQSTSDPRKGFQYLQPVLQRLSAQGWAAQAHLVVFGATEPADGPAFGLPAHYLGHIREESTLAALYAAADLFIAPSLQDNLPNTVLEALACGTPSVAFDIGGMPDMIEHQRTGYLVRPFEVEEMTQGVAWVLENDTRLQSLSQQARAKAEREFDLARNTQPYLDLYQELLQKFHHESPHAL